MGTTSEDNAGAGETTERFSAKADDYVERNPHSSQRQSDEARSIPERSLQ